MRNYFEIHYNKIKYPIDSGKSRGLRNAQLGAIHAVSSFFTLNVSQTEMYVEGFKAKLKKDTSYKGLWIVSFTLKEL